MRPAGHSSRAITISEPRLRWISMLRSGLRKWLEPSWWLLKATPSSVILRMEAREKT